MTNNVLTKTTTRSVTITIDDELLARIDADPAVRQHGRSAFVRAALEHYLAAKDARSTDDAIERAYAGQADAMLDEIADLVGAVAAQDAKTLA